jgi:hypothetical protein
MTTNTALATLDTTAVTALDDCVFSAAAKSNLYCAVEYNGQAPGAWHSSGTEPQQSSHLPSAVGQQASSKPKAAHLL